MRKRAANAAYDCSAPRIPAEAVDTHMKSRDHQLSAFFLSRLSAPLLRALRGRKERMFTADATVRVSSVYGGKKGILLTLILPG
jgi:hypothetical protein